MKLHQLALAALAAASITSAQAAVFNGATTVGATTVTDYSLGSALAFDIDFASLSSVTLNFSLESADFSGAPLTFNALVRDLSFAGFNGVNVKLSGISFAAPAGTITTDGFASVSASGSSLSQAWATFSPALTSEFYIGNPLMQAGAADWTLNLNGLQAGDQFSIMVAVPEPETYAMLVAGLAVVASVARRRQRV
jgi:hypothetical protein